MSDQIFALFQNLPLHWVVFFTSVIPITELRAAIPFGIAYGLHPFTAFIFGVLGNLLPIPFIILFWPFIYRAFYKIPFMRRFLEHYVDRAREKGRTMEKYGALGLMLFVGIPLPITGVWTGSLISYLLGLNPLYSFLSLAGGVLISATIVTLASVGFIGLAESIGLVEVLLLLAIVGLIIFWLVRKYRKNHKRGNL